MNPMTTAKNNFIRNKFRYNFKRGGIKDELDQLLLYPDNLDFSRKLGVEVPSFKY